MKRIAILGTAAALLGGYMTRSLTPGDILARAPDGLARVAEVGRADAEARTVELSFASEVPVSRWFGEEVLSLDAGAMRTERLDGGAPLLWDHDWGNQIGVVESWSIGADRKARAVVRFSKSGQGAQIFDDIVDGIRRHVSVGYKVHELRQENREGRPDLITVTDWEPFEISIVAVPADPSVGVGRSARETPEATPAPVGEGAAIETLPAVAGNERGLGMLKILRNAAGDLVRAKVDGDGNIVEVVEVLERAGDGEREVLQRGTQAERTRAATILNMGAQYDARDLAQEFVQNNRSPEEFQAELLTRMARQRGLNEDGTPIQTGLSADDVRRFSFTRALNALANLGDRAAQEAAAFEFEASRAAAAATGRDVRGIMVPQEVLARAMMTTGASGGNNLIETALDSGNFVDLLRARSVINRLATPLNGLVGNVDIPKLTQGSQGYWVGEGADATQSELVIGQIQIRPKTVGGFLETTRRMMMQSTLDVENMFRRDLAAALGSTIDVAGLYGAGGALVPLGLANTPGVNLKDLAAAYATYGEIVDMETMIAMDNADVSQMATVLSPTSRGRFKTTEKFAGTGKTIWEEGNTLNGYGTEVTTNVQAGDLFFGNFADMIFASWGGLDLTVDPYSKSKSGGVQVIAFKDVDIVVRRGESFAYAHHE